MHKLKHHMTSPPLFLYLCFFFCLLSYFNNVGVAGAGENPLTPTAFMKRYWKKQICNDIPIPSFLLNKACPLTVVESATFSKLASTNQTALSASLPHFCYSANLFCCPHGECEKPIGKNVGFAVYSDKNFTNYGIDNLGGSDSFRNYSRNENLPNDSFRLYSSHSVDHGDNFTNYSPNSNNAHQEFGTYGTAATGGTGNFTSYTKATNDRNIDFTTYSSDTQGRQQEFESYSDDYSNVGNESFTSYGKRGDGAVNGFNSYGKESNVMTSTFNGYGQAANRANNSFTLYGSVFSNVPHNDFKNYGHGGKAEVDSFVEYRNFSNVGEDSFKAYGQGSMADNVTFVNYGKSFNIGSDNFTGYGKGAKDESVGFTSYGVNNTFKEYAKTGGTISFSQYVKNTSPARKLSTGNSSSMGMMMMMSEKVVNGFVEPGKFFRESMLTTGTIMPMPDIYDKMPKRSFLSRGISSKLPFSTLTLPELKRIFRTGENSSMASILASTVGECERAPSARETKRCVGSIEDMIDFVVSVLGCNVVVRTTENTNGSNTYVMIGKVIGINGGNVTTSVSCHQSLFPYLLYYCHSVPKVRVYEVEILDPKTKAKINHGVAICHLDTSSWSAGHGAFLALGSGPGEIEVCHWIFENDMTWHNC